MWYVVLIDRLFCRRRSTKRSSEHTATRIPFAVQKKHAYRFVLFLFSRPFTDEKTLEDTSPLEIKKESRDGPVMAPTATDTMGGAEA